MTYRKYDELTILKTSSCKEDIAFDVLAKAISAKPSNVLYCECCGVCYGIISSGDIARACDMNMDTVPVNKNFIHIFPAEVMKAREILGEKKNINALPVVDENNVLLGDIIRWDDLKTIRYIYKAGNIQWLSQSYKCVCLVYPCAAFQEKQNFFEIFRDHLLSNGIKVNCIEHDEIIKFLGDSNWILFVDEEERRAVYVLYAYIRNEDLKGANFGTYKEFVKKCCYYNESVGILKNLKEKGVHVFNLTWDHNIKNSGYMQRLLKEIADRYAAVGKQVANKLEVSMYQSFFEELYSEEYVNDIASIPAQIETQSGCGKLKDCYSKVYNVINGQRYTYGQPENYDRTIWFVGACYMYGACVEDKNTIESFLQRQINEAGYKAKVVNCSSPAYNRKYEDLMLARILTLPLRKGDVIICGYGDFTDVDQINLIDVCCEHNIPAKWMTDHPMHCNHKLSAIYADAIYDRLKDILREVMKGQRPLLGIDEDFIKTIYIDRYFKNFNLSMYHKIGSIVMNCNPFTYGHRYLIEQALEQVDFLIIFVVEEDSSLISFEERYAMVCEGITDLNHVAAVPGGPFILAKTTFPEYFIKEADENLVENVENDIKIFAKKIAYYLNIRYRFAGQEPEDMVTNEYNLAMKKILPKSGIEFVEIPRKKQMGSILAALLREDVLRSMIWMA